MASLLKQSSGGTVITALVRDRSPIITFDGDVTGEVTLDQLSSNTATLTLASGGESETSVIYSITLGS